MTAAAVVAPEPSAPWTPAASSAPATASARAPPPAASPPTAAAATPLPPPPPPATRACLRSWFMSRRSAAARRRTSCCSRRWRRARVVRFFSAGVATSNTNTGRTRWYSSLVTMEGGGVQWCAGRCGWWAGTWRDVQASAAPLRPPARLAPPSRCAPIKQTPGPPTITNKNKKETETCLQMRRKKPIRCALGRGSPRSSRIALTNWCTQMEESGGWGVREAWYWRWNGGAARRADGPSARRPPHASVAGR